MYQVDVLELNNPPRVVICSACLHEWYALRESLIWGDEAALQALNYSSNESMYQSTFPSTDNSSTNPQVQASSGDNDQPDLTTTNTTESIDLVQNMKQIQSNTADNESISKLESEYESTTFINAPCIADQVRNREDSSRPLQHSEHGNRLPADFARDPGDTELNLDPQSTVNNSCHPKPANEDEQRDDSNVASVATKTGKPGICIFVRNLSFRATEEDLYRAFSGHGLVVNCQVPLDSCGASKGYGFVEMSNRDNGLKAMKTLEGVNILGQVVTLVEAHGRPKVKRRGFYSTIDGKRQSRYGSLDDTESRNGNGDQADSSYVQHRDYA